MQSNGKHLLYLALSLSIFLLISTKARADIKTEQLRWPRVRAAYTEKELAVREMFRDAGVEYPPDEIYFRAFKTENGKSPGSVELWARSGKMKMFRLVRTWRVCASSGGPGPKRRQGDGQVPEGFYEIAGFNPSSRFHLALKISYPNRSDNILKADPDAGGDIFMHGDCVTIGCIPMTDDVIKQVYVAAVEAKNKSGRPIRYHIFPARMTDDNYKMLMTLAGDDIQLRRFWGKLREGYLLFERTKIPPAVTVDKSGAYHFKQMD